MLGEHKTDSYSERPPEQFRLSSTAYLTLSSFSNIYSLPANIPILHFIFTSKQ